MNALDQHDPQANPSASNLSTVKIGFIGAGRLGCALAWALARCGEIDEAQRHMSLALAQGTQDARLYFHATVISTLAGKTNEAITWLKKTEPFTPLLLPSEASQLRATAALLAPEKISRGATAPSMAAPEHFPGVARKSTGTEN